jgi:hypothetical protein
MLVQLSWALVETCRGAQTLLLKARPYPLGQGVIQDLGLGVWS